MARLTILFPALGSSAPAISRLFLDERREGNGGFRRSARMACHAFEGVWGRFPNKRIRALGPGCTACEVLIRPLGDDNQGGVMGFPATD